MHLSPREIEKLMLHHAGFLAQKRLARGVHLNLPESLALIATQVLELIRDGRSVAELMDLGRTMLGQRQVMSGVAEMVHEVQVEGTFPDGTKLVTIHDPIVAEDGDLALALYGSFLPVPDLDAFARTPEDKAGAEVPGLCMPLEGDILLNEGRGTVQLSVRNLGDRPIQVGSHYHFVETNASLEFDRAAAYGRRLDTPAGTAVRFEPGETRTVTLIDIGGRRVIRGGNNLAGGPVSDDGRRRALELVRERKFAHNGT